MAGSNRSRSRNWMARHSARSRAPTPGRFEPLDEVEDAFGLFQRRTETCGDFFERTGEIAVLVDQVDQYLSGQPVGRPGRCEPQLNFQMVLEIGWCRDIGFEVCRRAVSGPSWRPGPR